MPWREMAGAAAGWWNREVGMRGAAMPKCGGHSSVGQ